MIKRKKVFSLHAKILLLIGSLCIFLLLGEIMARLLFNIPRDIDYGIYPDMIGDHLPNQNLFTMHTSHDMDAPSMVRINSEGLRGREVARSKKRGTERILCLGDSFTFGLFLNDGDTFPDYLQKIMDEKSKTVHYEVINAGHLDYTVTEELEYLQERGLLLQPDWVILQFTAVNDIEDLTRCKSMRDYYKSTFSANSWIATAQRFLRRWRLYQLMLYELTRARAYYSYKQIHPEANEGFFDTHVYFDAVDKSWKICDNELNKGETESALSTDLEDRLSSLWDRYADTLASLQQLLRGRGVKLLLLFFPDPRDLAEDTRPLRSAGYAFRAEEKMRALVAKLGIANYVDLTSSFKNQHQTRGSTIYKKLHPTAEASRIAAQEVAELILKRDQIRHVENAGHGRGLSPRAD